MTEIASQFPEFFAAAKDSLRLEAIVTCVGFDDFLEVTLQRNMPHLDTMIVVTSPEDRKTIAVATKYDAVIVQTDLFKREGRRFNKGAALQHGLMHFRYRGWRLGLDADIVLPDNFRRLLQAAPLDQNSLYGADRVHTVGMPALEAVSKWPQHSGNSLRCELPLVGRFISPLYGYVPLGYFQLWHSSAQKDYPHSIGTAEYDDVLFGAQWPEERRHLLPSAIVYHLCTDQPSQAENWDGCRRHRRLDSE